MRDPQSPSGAPEPADERVVARKYGLRELVYPDREQIKAFNEYLRQAIESHRSGPVPKTAIVMLLEFLQGTVNRQNITKSPLMSPEEFDLLTTPYYLVTRILSRIAREGQGQAVARGQMYQASYASLNTFMELLRSLLDPGCYWLRLKTIPDGVIEQMHLLRAFANALPEQRRKGRAM
jgi:hypothetical protein